MPDDDLEEPRIDAKGNPVYPAMPLGGHLLQAGFALRDAAELDVEIRKRAAIKLRRFLEGHPEVAAAVCPFPGREAAVDFEKRAALNRAVIAEVIGELRFEASELRRLEKGLGLGLARREEPKRRARVYAATGEVVDFEVRREGAGSESDDVVVRDLSTGDVSVHRADAAEITTYHDGGGQTRTRHAKPAGEA